MIQGVQEKLGFLTIHCNLSLTYIAARDLQSSRRNMRVDSLSYWLDEGEGANFREFFEKNTLFNEHPVHVSHISYIVDIEAEK